MREDRGSRVVTVRASRNMRETRDDHIGPECADHAHHVAEHFLLSPFRETFIGRFAVAEIHRAGEELFATIDPPCFEQFLRTNDPERITKLRSDQVLSAFAAREAQVCRAHFPAIREPRDQPRVLIIGMRGDVQHAAQNVELLHAVQDLASVRLPGRALRKRSDRKSEAKKGDQVHPETADRHGAEITEPRGEDAVAPLRTMDLWLVLEVIAVAGNLAYTVLMMLNKRIGWLFGIAASSIGAAIFLHQHVYAQVGLNIFYMVMGIYGWLHWGRGVKGELPITRRNVIFHMAVTTIAIFTAGLLAWLLQQFPDPQHTELDGFVTGLSFIATWLLARRILENWVYWIVADAFGIWLYLLLGLYWYAGLFAIYVVLSIAGLIRWSREMREAPDE